MPSSVLPFLMFQGEGSDAIDLYLSIFPDAKIEQLDRYEEGEGPPPGTLKMARISIAGQSILCNDSPVKHAFTFTPSSSFFVECTSQDEVRRISEALKQGGTELMPVGNYGFSTLFAWVSDRFGVSWQLNYA